MRWATLWIVGVGVSTVLAAEERPAVPLGVYWAGETTFQEVNDDVARWQRIEACLDDMAAHHVNALWMTHLSVAETAQMARLADTRGIRLVASCLELAGNYESVRNGDHQALIAETLATWGDAPPPLAWGLGDEPQTEYMDEMAAYVNAWKTYAPGQPVTTVVTWTDLKSASTAGFDRLACDVYPFGEAAVTYSTDPWNAWLSITRRNVRAHAHPWMMGQCFQLPSGNHTVDEQGNIVYYRRGSPSFEMPTPEQVAWQAWAGLAEGARGLFFFGYRGPTIPIEDDLPRRVKNSGSPWGMTYPDGTPTPQYDALGDAFEQIAALQPVLARLQADPDGFAQLRRATPDSSLVRVLRDTETGRRFLLAVGGYEAPVANTLIVQLGPNVLQLTRVSDGSSMPLLLNDGLWETSLLLPAGTGELFALIEDADNQPVVYRDDLSTLKMFSDCLKIKKLQRYPTNLSDYLVSAIDSSPWPNAFVVYDLQRLVGELPQNGLRALSYRGVAEPPETRGVLWSTSDTGRSFVDVSQNQFDQAVRIPPRFLRCSVSWHGAEGTQYGYLSEFGIWQWDRAAQAPGPVAKSRTGTATGQSVTTAPFVHELLHRLAEMFWAFVSDLRAALRSSR